MLVVYRLELIPARHDIHASSINLNLTGIQNKQIIFILSYNANFFLLIFFAIVIIKPPALIRAKALLSVAPKLIFAWLV